MRSHPLVFAALLVALGCGSGVQAQAFEWFFEMHTGFRTSGAAAADFDRDGDIDLAFAAGEHFPSPTLVFSNDGRGNFVETQRLTGRYQKGHATKAGDLDGDGWPDLVLITEIGDRNVVFLNDGRGRLVWAARFGRIGDNGRDAAVVDLDRDGRPDVVVANRGQPNAAYRNTGPAALEHWFDFGGDGSATVGLAAADLNGDGWPDVVTVDWSGESRGVHVWLNDGHGGLAHSGRYGSREESVFAVDLGDVDGDGRADIAVAVGQHGPASPDAEGFEYDEWQPGGRDYLLFNDGRGSFDRRRDFGAADESSGSIRLADLDRDGDLDMAVGYSRGDWFYSYEGPGREFWFDRRAPGHFGAIWLNDGRGGLERGSGFGVHSIRDLSVADVNADGFPDLVVASGSGLSAAYLNSLGPAVGRWASARDTTP